LNDDLNAPISMSLKLKEEMNNLPLLDVLIDGDGFSLNIDQLKTFAKNMKKEVIGSSSFSFPS
jgi:hypothetical protein